MSFCNSCSANCTCSLDIHSLPHCNSITTMANRITPLGFPSNIFYCENYTLSGYSPKGFFSLLRLLTPYIDDRKLERVLLIGIELNFFNSVAHCQPKEFYSFLRHLRTRPGQNELQKMEALEKLEKRAAARGLTLKEMASVAITEAKISHIWKPRNANKLKVAQEILDDSKQKNADKLEIPHEAAYALEYDEQGVPSEIHATEENHLDGGGSSGTTPRIKRPKLEVSDPEVEKY